MEVMHEGGGGARRGADWGVRLMSAVWRYPRREVEAWHRWLLWGSIESYRR